MKKIIVIIGILFALIGCSSNNESKSTVVCKYEEEPWSIEYTFTATGDELVKETTYQTYLWKGYMTEAEIAEELQAIETLYSQADGIDYHYELTDEKAIETLIIDYELASVTQLTKLGLLESGDSEDAYASLERTVKNLEESGSTCK